MFVVEPLHDERYCRLYSRLLRLEAWLELAVTPPEEECFLEDKDLLGCPDDLPRLRERCESVRRELGAALPPQRRDHLRVEASKLQDAGLGLFAAQPLEEGAVVAHYAGDLHDLRTSQKLQDQSYVMRLGVAGPGNDEIASGCIYVDAGPREEIWARYINDCRNVRGYNLDLVCRPEKHLAELVTRRPIAEGEELFFDYGEKYWDDRALLGGHPPARLAHED